MIAITSIVLLFVFQCFVLVNADQQKNIQTIKVMYDHFAKGDISVFISSLADKYTIKVLSDAQVIPYLTDYTDVNAYLANFPFIYERLSVRSMTSSENDVVVLLDCKIKNKATGKSAETIITESFKFNSAGKVIEYLEIRDTASTVDLVTNRQTAYTTSSIATHIINHYNAREYDALYSYFEPDAKVQTNNDPQVTIDVHKVSTLAWIESFPDAKLTIIDMVPTEDTVVFSVRSTCTFTGKPFHVFKPDGKSANYIIVLTLKVKNGKVTLMRLDHDSLAVVTQLGWTNNNSNSCSKN